MHKKILKKYTTIPQHLYVERSADKQLRDIIEDMQRPGYVLVARQMGKTNLLFNAKRNLETDERKFVYIDLSNNFDTELECYNYIIDSILDVLDEELWEIRPEIDKIRDLNRANHITYTRSLSVILKCLEKDLVIILDEIDALRTSEYSDNIFAVIRSNYFTRSNFPEFNHLTYILSGVIEPKDLIKDRNKSPFNIGEKIYLDDFTYSEFLSFIDKSELKITNDIVERIYYWTSGNPRISFDICSDLESVLIEKKSLTCVDLDELVRVKYLRTFDLAPIDHIRELISENKDIQSALVDIITDKNPYVTDAIKSKLYLYGITSSNNNDENISVKNKLIKESIPLNWLKSLTQNSSDMIDRATQLVDNAHNYHEAIEILQPILDDDEHGLEPFELSLALYYLATAQHHIGEYERSNINFLKSPISKNASPALHYREKLLTGQNHYLLGDAAQGYDALKYVIDNYENTVTWTNAALNLAVYNMNTQESYELLNRIISSLPSTTELEVEGKETTLNFMNEMQSYAYYYLSQSEKIKNKKLKIEYIDQAIELNVTKFIPTLLLHKSSETDSLDYSMTKKIINYIIENQIRIKDSTTTKNALEYNKTLNYSLLSFSFSVSEELFIKLLNYTKDNLRLSEESIYIKTSGMAENYNDRYNILHKFITDNPKTSSLELLRNYCLSSYSINSSDLSYFERYIDISIKDDKLGLKEIDITLISLMLRYCLNNGRHNNVERYIESLSNKLSCLEGLVRYNSSAIYYWAFESTLTTNNVEKCHTYGHEILERLNNKVEGKTVFTESGEKNIKDKVTDVLYYILSERAISNRNYSNISLDFNSDVETNSYSALTKIIKNKQ
ncbi:AAA-like domain-containing protein [Vibrio cyclitrophicus]|uniref:AAA-like domain-containing protein n=1 Tax=Vibrio cyclitrophicus TaxID=47951 RepID=UPI0002FDE789|nr:AAA-like domain-containing protein [Vibrio cyclitrophicus]OEE17903.1 hypothetical protein OC1_07810 [Vibrio cyclitrophicus ZF207]